MISENQLREIVEQVLREMDVKEKGELEEDKIENNVVTGVKDEDLLDITQVDLRKQILVENPMNEDAYLKLKESTAARVGISKAGARCKTESVVRFRADHAVAMDAVFTDVSDGFLKDMGLDSVVTLVTDQDEYLTRPDLGRRFSEETLEYLKENFEQSPQVLVYISDGLSSTAIETNAKDTYKAIEQGLKSQGIKVGSPFFVKYGRVAAMEPIAQVLNPDVIAVLIGERPGLATGESMSCYMAYRPTIGMPESRRTVISNIHKGGTPAVEAGAHIADVIKAMLEQKASGLDLKL